jgi:excinuclease ABC subunit B
MQAAIDITQERRAQQEAHNKKHNITPTSVKRNMDDTLKQEEYADIYDKKKKDKIPKGEKQKIIKEYQAKMLQAAKNLDFEVAASYRDKIADIKKM